MSPNKILIVNQNWLGDVLFSTPAIRAIRKKFPASYIACLVPPRCETVLKRNPHLNKIILCGDRVNLFSPDFWGAVRRIRAGRFDQVVFFHRSKTKAWMTRLAGIPARLDYEPLAGRVHKIDHFLNLLSRFSIPADGRALDFCPDPAAETRLQDLLSESGLSLGAAYVVVHAGGNWGLKRWPAKYFAEWIRLFRKKFPWKVILCGTDSERKICDEIVSVFPNGEAFSLCGRTSLDVLALLLKNARFLLSNDSGPIHLAASQRTKIIGLFGPTDPALTGPVSDAPLRILRKDVGCEVPCYFRSCDDHACMNSLTPEEVFHEAQSF